LYNFCRAGWLPSKLKPTPMQLTGFTVLVVEDDVDNLELLISHLEQEGALVLGAENVNAALRLASEHAIDALLCDLELPDGDGCGVLQKLRDRPGSSDLPAIALTGYSDAGWRKAANDCGFDRYAVKPFPLQELTAWLAEIIDRQSGLRAMTSHALPEAAARDLRRR
jgi:CheY-like chemotaxis protein